MKIHTPWIAREESHLGDIAFSIVESTGMRVAVGLTRSDAELICRLVNARADELKKARGK